jgi:hypothetical protein
MAYWIGTLLLYIGSPMVTCMLIGKVIVVVCWTCTPFAARTNCFSPKVGILIGYWFYTNYSTSGTSSNWVTLVASTFYFPKINGSDPLIPK